ncbi:MAG: biosynthetic peptidoglycan transglycosylase, partial [Bacteroidota bacterium]|nr:biosynthetic peptidoglycan transglycosylase [Bacteroidota bacterium]
MDKQKTTKLVVKIIWIGTFLGVFTMSLIFILISTGKLGYIPPFDELENPKTNLATEIYSADNVLLGKYYNENRTIVQFEDLSPNVVNALLATEDIRFYSHSGVDFRALTRVFVKTVLLGKDAGGGSTISQQLAKNLYRMREKDIANSKAKIARKFSTGIMKFQEWVTAAKLERNYTKDEIMVMYLNTVSFGHNAFGIKSAAFTFFGKTSDSLSLQDAAVLVGLLKAPTRYSPIMNPNRAFNRRNTVYSQIEKYQKKLNKLTGWQIKPEAFFDSLKNKPIEIEYHKQTHNVGLATYFREFLRIYINANEPQKENYPSWNIQQFRDDSLSWVNNPIYGWCNKNLKPDGKPYNIY